MTTCTVTGYLAALSAEQRVFVESLSAQGVSIFVAPPGGEEFSRPLGWQSLTADGNRARLERFCLGDALGAITGHTLAVVDVDPRNGGNVGDADSLLARLGVRVFARVETPGSGMHFIVAGSADLASSGNLDGLPGVDIQSHGRHVFLPGTSRPKYAGHGYRIVDASDLDALHEGDVEGSEALASFVAERRARGKRNTDAHGVAPMWNGAPPDARQASYLAAALQSQAADVAQSKRGQRNAALFLAALKLGSFVKGAGLDETEVVGALLDASERNLLTADDGLASVRATIRSGIRTSQPLAVPAARTSQAPPPVFGRPVRVEDDEEGTARRLSLVNVSDPLSSAHSAAQDIHRSWRPTDLAPILAGTFERLSPTILVRTDGNALLYPRCTHSVHGEPESGKSMIALIAAKEVLATGGSVAYLDGESDASTVIGRMLDLGAAPEEVRERFAYVRPEADPRRGSFDRQDFADLLGQAYELVVIDGVTEFLGMFGFSSNDNDEVIEFFRALPRLFADRGASVVLIDHVTKSSEGRGRFAIGGQAKLAAISGAAYQVDVEQQIGRGMRGALLLRVVKDRPGAVREHCATTSGKRERSQIAARVVIDSTDTASMVVIVEPVDESGRAGPTQFRPTAIMEKVSRVVEVEPGLSSRKVVERVSAKREHVFDALRILVVESFIATETGARNAILHRSIRIYRQSGDPLSDNYIDLGTSA